MGTPLQIPAGESAVLVPGTTSFVAGISNITATVSVSPLGYAVGSALVNTVTPAPSQLGVYVQPGVFPTGPNRASPQLFIQLEDSNGNPAKARSPTSVSVISTNATVFSKNLTVTISQGADYTIVPVTPSTFGSTTFEASSPGLASSSATLKILPSSYSSSILASSIAIFINQTSTVSLTVKLDNQGLPGAKVIWNSTSGRLSTPNSTTDSSGLTSVVVTPTRLGPINVSASITSPLIGTKYENLAIAVVTPPQTKTSQSLTATLLSFPYYLIFVGIGAVVVLVAFFLIRRRGSTGGEDFGEEEEGFAFMPRLVGAELFG